MEIELVKVACPIVAGNPDGYYLAESLPAGAKLYEDSKTVIGLQPEPEDALKQSINEAVWTDVDIVEPEPVAKTIITVDIPDTRSNEYFNAMTDNELKEYLDSNKVKYHHLAGRKTLFTAASAFANLGVR